MAAPLITETINLVQQRTMLADANPDDTSGINVMFQVENLKYPAEAIFPSGGVGIRVTGKGTAIIGIADDWPDAAAQSAAVVGRNETDGVGVLGSSDEASGVLGNSLNGAGVEGRSRFGEGVIGGSTSLPGVFGTSSSGEGVRGVSISGPGVSGRSYHGWAGFFDGKVQVTGSINKAATAFKIDHPLDPATKYLYHSGVESPDMKNFYDGVAVLDADGAAIVELPIWFGVLNQDLRYQLTAIGASAPNLHVSQEVVDNRFKIAGGTFNTRVSWQVTGIRKDAWAQAHRTPVEERKTRAERGRYLHPELFGEPLAKGIDAAHSQETAESVKEQLASRVSLPRFLRAKRRLTKRTEGGRRKGKRNK